MIIPRKTTSTFLLFQKQITLFLTVGIVTSVLLFVLFGVLHVELKSQPVTAAGMGSSTVSAQNINSTSLSQTTHTEQMHLDNQINVKPALPNSGDSITITVSGTWFNSCFPSYQSHQVTDNLIRIDAESPQTDGIFCHDTLTPWRFSVPISSLMAGDYRVDVYVTAFDGFLVSQDTTFFTVRQASISVLIPKEGGQISHHYPRHNTTLIVPAGSLSMPATFTISYQMPPTATGRLLVIDHFFDLMSSQTVFTLPLTLTVRYSDTALGLIVAGTENLYQLQSGQWVTDNITVTTRLSDGISAQITRLSSYGILGETKSVLLPIFAK
ncbi:hypothetical protein KFU94_18580 [Chloroflexi bacterium TSY]|nr:hypothetical protein [Chloroflexi bacterium TSY]